MPKVTQEYLDKKKEMIVDAAYQVCLKKPVEMVTISDVIAETGMSMGAIYRYYDGLDEILADMLKKLRKEYDYYERIEKLSQEKDLSFEEITYRACDIIGDVMEKHLMDIQKINFDLTVLAINEPERAEKIIKGIKGKGNMDHLKKVIFPYLFKASAEHKLEAKHDPMELYQFISSAYVGIETNCILTACYSKDQEAVSVDPKAMFDILATTIILLLAAMQTSQQSLRMNPTTSRATTTTFTKAERKDKGEIT